MEGYETIQKEMQVRVEYYVQHYILPLIGYTIDDCKNASFLFNEKDEHCDIKTTYIFDESNYFFSCTIKTINDANKSANKKIFKDLLLDYMLFEKNSKAYIPFKKEEPPFYQSIYRYMIEKGICRWINPDEEIRNKIEKLIKTLEDWSVKTYEGHHVCYGFAIDLDCKEKTDRNDYHKSFMDFLDDEYSAVLSDGFSSLIKLDQNCNFIDYLSLTKGGSIAGCKVGNKLPYRFVQLIDKYIAGNVIGVFLLQNGDIIISKEKEIKFIKRNNKWLNFSASSFTKSIQNNTNKPFDTDKLDDVYVAALDVSLAHSGGIIAVVDYKKFKEDNIINRIDDLNIKSEEAELFFAEFKEKIEKMELKSENKAEIEIFIKEKNKIGLRQYMDDENISELNVLNHEIIKRMTKRNILMQLLGNGEKFTDMDHKLRTELIGMDGACIVDLDFNIISFGAIICNDAGSSGGGRAAAAKKLSCFDGFSIKISTDGYIEVYVKGEKVYSIK